MPVTFPIASHPAEPYNEGKMHWRRRTVPSSDPYTVLSSVPTVHTAARLLGSSIDGSQRVVTKKNGFVLGALLAYNAHHNLVIRPDDVWIAILSQLNFYINAHAEELRDKFVSHEGKKYLVVSTDAFVDQADFGELAIQMSEKIHEDVKDKTLVPWVIPDFSTTTVNDKVICSALIMSSLKQYYNYAMICRCGIPSITIEGTQADWQSIYDRIDKISEFGEEPTDWADMLRTIIRRFVRAFEEDGPDADATFWERIVHEEAGSGVYFLSGWIGAFCAWDIGGRYFPSRKYQESSYTFTNSPQWVHGLTFDGVWFPRVWSPPEGYAEVDVLVVDLQTGEKLDCTMLAGHVGVAIEGKEKMDTVRIAPQWFMYVKGKERKPGTDYWD